MPSRFWKTVPSWLYGNGPPEWMSRSVSAACDGSELSAQVLIAATADGTAYEVPAGVAVRPKVAITERAVKDFVRVRMVTGCPGSIAFGHPKDEYSVDYDLGPPLMSAAARTTARKGATDEPTDLCSGAPDPLVQLALSRVPRLLLEET